MKRSVPAKSKLYTRKTEVRKRKKRRRSADTTTPRKQSAQRAANVSVNEKVISRLQEYARLAADNPEELRNKAQNFMKRADEGLHQVQSFVQLARQSPNLRRGLENLVIQNLGKKLGDELTGPSAAEQYMREQARRFKL